MTQHQASPVPTGSSATPEPENLNLYHIAQWQFDHAARYLPDLKAGLMEFLRRTARSISVEFPVEMDDGSVRVFAGHRMLHSRIRGPGKGGIQRRQLLSATGVFK